MKCPYCGYVNIKGSDECESCNENLASLDGVVPRTKIEKVLMSDPISKISSKPVLSVMPKTSIYDAVCKMNASKVGCLLVVEEGAIRGILTERDIVHKALAAGKDLTTTSVDTAMTQRADCLLSEDTLACALNHMAVGGFRHIPILSNGVPVGIISIRDVLKYLAKLFP